MKKSLLIAIAMLAITVFSACTAKQLPESTINLQLQNSVDSIVKQDMKEFRCSRRYGNRHGDLHR